MHLENLEIKSERRATQEKYNEKHDISLQEKLNGLR